MKALGRLAASVLGALIGLGCRHAPCPKPTTVIGSPVPYPAYPAPAPGSTPPPAPDGFVAEDFPREDVAALREADVYRVRAVEGRVEIQSVPNAEPHAWPYAGARPVTSRCRPRTRRRACRHACIFAIWTFPGRPELGAGDGSGLWQRAASGEWQRLETRSLPVAVFEWNGGVHYFVIEVAYQMVGALGTLAFVDGHWVAQPEVRVPGGIGAFTEYTDGSLMVFTRDGILRVRGDRDVPRMEPVVAAPYAGKFLGNPIQADSMAATDDGVVYVGTRGGVLRAYPSARGWAVDWLRPAARG